jgi:hypothetical protein
MHHPWHDAHGGSHADHGRHDGGSAEGSPHDQRVRTARIVELYEDLIAPKAVQVITSPSAERGRLFPPMLSV